MKDVRAPAGFRWNTIKTVELDLHNVPNRVIRISSEDQTVLYQKFMGTTGGRDEQLSIAVPTTITAIRIDTCIIPIGTSAVDYTFPPQKKSAQFTTNYALKFNGTSDWVKVP